MIKTEKHINITLLDNAKLWLEYTPDWWKLDELLEKPAKDLTEDELNILLTVKKDKRMLANISYFKDLAINNNGRVSLTLDEVSKLDEIYSYLERDEGFLKISAEEREYVSMLYHDYSFSTVSLMDQALANISSSYLKEFAIREKPYLPKKTDGSSRSKGHHSVFPYTPKRII